MVAYNFDWRFADMVASGRKDLTLRREPPGARHAQAGEPVQLYVGLRTRDARKLIRPDPICIVSCRVVVARAFVQIPFRKVRDPTELSDFANRDGHDSWSDLVVSLGRRYGLPFRGHLIIWAPSRRARLMQGDVRAL